MCTCMYMAHICYKRKYCYMRISSFIILINVNSVFVFFLCSGHLPHDSPVFLLSTLALPGPVSTQGRHRRGQRTGTMAQECTGIWGIENYPHISISWLCSIPEGMQMNTCKYTHVLTHSYRCMLACTHLHFCAYISTYLQCTCIYARSLSLSLSLLFSSLLFSPLSLSLSLSLHIYIHTHSLTHSLTHSCTCM